MFDLGPGTLSLILVGLLILGLGLGVPVAFTLLGSAGLLIFVFFGWKSAASIYWMMFAGMNTFVLAAIPLFIFMGVVLERSGIAEQLFDAMYKWLGRLRGGLAVGTIVICAIFAACTGIVGAAVVTMAYVALPAMLKRGYKKDLAIGAVTGGGTLGPLIPPSVPMITLGLFGQVSIGGLFMSGVFSGLLVAFVMVLIILVRCYFFDPELGPSLPKERASAGKRNLSH